MARGFFVPGSQSSNFVSQQRGAGGEFRWDTAASEVGLGHQAALQNLNRQYSQTINQAYSGFLQANRGIRGSMMGQGFQEAYRQQIAQGLQAQVAETNLNVANVRQQLGQAGMEQLTNIGAAFQQETEWMDRIGTSLQGYFEYLQGLWGETEGFFEGIESAWSYDAQGNRQLRSLDALHDIVWGAQPTGYFDPEGQAGMSFISWLNRSIGDTQRDAEWSRWLFGMGGFQQFNVARQRGVQSLVPQT